MALPVLSVANRILDMANEQGRSLDPLQLQKLVYLAQGWNLAFTGQPLVSDTFEAWQYGPVNPTLYHAFKKFRANTITDRAFAPQVGFTPQDEHLLREILRVYGGKSGLDLSGLTHQQGSAWRAVYKPALFSNEVIPDYLIKAEFDKRRADGRG